MKLTEYIKSISKDEKLILDTEFGLVNCNREMLEENDLYKKHLDRIVVSVSLCGSNISPRMKGTIIRII